MKKRYDRSAIMKRAHELKHDHAWGDALRLAWAEAKASGLVAVAPHRLPLEALALDAWAMARRIANGRIRAGIRVRIDVGLEIAPVGCNATQYGKSLERFAAISYEKQKRNDLTLIG